MSIINSQPRIGAAGQSTGFKIERSLRFNNPDTAYLDRTPASNGTRTIWTWSAWVKRSKVDTDEIVFSAGTGNPRSSIGFRSDNNRFYLRQVNSSNAEVVNVRTTQVFRDLSAWYHLVVVFDDTQVTSSNRVKIYVNGVQVTALDVATYPNQNETDLAFNSSLVHEIGRYAAGTSDPKFSGYMTEIHFLDGSTPTTTTRTVGGVTETVLTQFGEFDTDTGVWKPKAYSGSYGTNGFYLKFADNSGTTSTTLGKDSSGNGNNWTPNNFYVGPGTTNAEKAGIDSLVDTPTPYGTDTGAGGEVRGNYATWNPIYVIPSNTTSTFTNGNLDFSVSGIEGAGTASAVATMPLPTTGKWYWEITPTTAATGSPGRTMIGIMAQANINYVMADSGAGNFAYTAGGSKVNNGSYLSYGNSYTSNDVIGVAVDLDNGAIYFAKNGTWQNSGVPTSGSSKTGAAYTTLTGSSNYFPAAGYWGTYVANFGQRPFAYTAPSGFKALCTQNLPTPTIGATATTRADDYFNTVLYTGTGSSLGVTGVGFQPDFVWIKERSEARSHALFDVLRGATIRLYSDSTVGDQTETTTLTAFNTDGFTVSTSVAVNNSAQTYASWNWKANGAGVSNTAGSISSTVSANTTAGFSIITYTGNQTSGATIGHGLGVAPSFMIFKNRSGAYSWPVFHTSFPSSYWYLNTTDARVADAGYWPTAPSSTLITLGGYSENNRNGNNFVCYAFAAVAGYSAFGSYTGNGSADGPFIYTGFRPRYVLMKCTSAASQWLVVDTARSTYNVIGDVQLYPNASSAEGGGGWGNYMDIVSNGFKLRGFDNDNFNSSADTYIYAAFAENPFKYSLAR